MTVMIELAPTLSHCIEAMAKREYWKTADEYLKRRKDDRELEEKLELLRSFLETADFVNFRRQSEEHIINGKQVTFTLSIKNGKPWYEMNVE